MTARTKEGDDFVAVSRAVPGARLRIYDGVGVELGDGGGTVVMLRRTLVAGDELTVAQQLNQCVSSTGYRVSVLDF